MPFCQFCGKQYPEGSSCDCAESQGNNGGSFNPYANSGSLDSENKSGAVKGGLNNKNQVVGLAMIGAVILVVLILLFSLMSGGGYKKPVKNFVKGINNADTKKIIASMLPDSYVKELKEKYDDDWKDVIDEADDGIEDAMESLEDDYGKNVKVSVDFVSKKKADKDDLEELQELYDDTFDADVKKAYKVKVKLTIKGKEDEDSEKANLYVVKVKGDGWKLAPYDDARSFMYLTGVDDLF